VLRAPPPHLVEGVSAVHQRAAIRLVRTSSGMASLPPSQLLVRDLMTAPVVTLSARQSVALAEVVMKLKRIRHLPVVEEDRRLVGLVTHRDLLRAKISALAPIGRERRAEAELRVAVSQIMQTEVWSVSPAAPALNAARLLSDHRFGCLPVVEAGRLVGIVTEHDFLALVTDSLELGSPPPVIDVQLVMTPLPATLRVTNTLAEARAEMERLHIRHLPVVDDDGTPLGMISDRDLAIAEAIAGHGSSITVGLIGTEEPYVVAPRSDLGPVLLDLAAQQIGSAMVVDDGVLVGIITTTDACRLLGERLHEPRPER